VDNRTARPARRLRPAYGYVLALVAGLLLFRAVIAGMPYLFVAGAVLKGKPSHCPALHLLDTIKATERREALVARARAAVGPGSEARDAGLVCIRAEGRDFWIPEAGSRMAGRQLLVDLLAEHDWMIQENPDEAVRAGDVVLDCGAHVGTFTHTALDRGARKVVAFEINPQNLECLRRNFRQEIASGRVVVVDQGVWSSEGAMPFTLPETNSGMGSLIRHDVGTRTIQVPLVRIDTAVAKLGLDRVDYVKMDIEGAEREALAGAAATLARFKPRLMLDAYHRPDDAVVLPNVIRSARKDYFEVCGPCEYGLTAFQPHVLYFR
jgi:FkbM family methyltransferase